MKTLIYIQKEFLSKNSDWNVVADTLEQQFNTLEKPFFVVNDPSLWHVQNFQNLVNLYFDNPEKAQEKLEELKEHDLNLIHTLFEDENDLENQVIDAVLNLYVEIEWILEDIPYDPFDYIYDQIFSVGGLISNKILSHLLAKKGLKTWEWDARNYIKTDNLHCMAIVDTEATQNSLKKDLHLTDNFDFVCLSNGIGSTSENFTTTLGPKGILKTVESLAQALEVNQYLKLENNDCIIKKI